jgi:uncharacterized protein (UPF0147 family)
MPTIDWIPLSDLTQRLRAAEKAARLCLRDETEYYEIRAAPGCHQEPYFDPPVDGYVVTLAAAKYMEAKLYKMPDHTAHTRHRIWSIVSEAEGFVRDYVA